MGGYKRLSSICRLSHEAKLKHGRLMRRFLLIAAVATSACSDQEAAAPPLTAGIYAGSGRDRLCLSRDNGGARIAIIAYGEGDDNCTIQAKASVAEQGVLVEAVGDPACKFFIASAGTTLTLPERLPASCDYYCGPSASLANKKFTRAAGAAPVADLAGDPLC